MTLVAEPAPALSGASLESSDVGNGRAAFPGASKAQLNRGVRQGTNRFHRHKAIWARRAPGKDRERQEHHYPGQGWQQDQDQAQAELRPRPPIDGSDALQVTPRLDHIWKRTP